MQDQPTAPKSSESYDGSLHWPNRNGAIVRITPFHISAYGITRGEEQAEGETVKGYVVWCMAGGIQFQTFCETEKEAQEQFKRIHAAKVAH